MIFLSPEWFWLWVPVAFYLFERYRSGSLLLNRKTVLMLLAMGAIVIAMARPALQQAPVEITQQGRDVIIGIDLSYSMRASDLDPSRLEYAKALLRELIAQNTKDRFGIIGFTTNAIVLSPLSDDHEVLLHLFERLDENLIMTKGTRLMPVLELARKMSRSSEPMLLLLSDGGDQQDFEKEVAFAKNNGLHVNVAMLASSRGSTITKADGMLLEDEAGNIVISRANTAIVALAQRSGGEMLDMPEVSDIAALLDKAAQKDFEQKKKVITYTELFYLFVLLAIIFAMLAFTTLYARLLKKVAPLLLLLGLDVQAGMFDALHVTRANAAYTHGAYLEAAQHFEQLESPQSRYNAANSYYKAGAYEKALMLYNSIKSSDAAFKARVFFNAGNCYVRLKEFDKARAMFWRSLTLRDDTAARENIVALLGAEAQDHMLTGRQQGKKRAQEGQRESSSEGKRKEGGGANMDVSADASGSGDDGGKKVQGDPRLSFSHAKGKLSSRQYELINQRSVSETKPW